MEFVAVTVNVYVVDADKPETVIVPAVAPDNVPVNPPVDDVAVYPVIVAPPSDAGAVKLIVAVVDPVDVATPMVGESGTNAVLFLLTKNPLVVSVGWVGSP
jgi:hypothetical protein